MFQYLPHRRRLCDEPNQVHPPAALIFTLEPVMTTAMSCMFVGEVLSIRQLIVAPNLSFRNNHYCEVMIPLRF